MTRRYLRSGGMGLADPAFAPVPRARTRYTKPAAPHRLSNDPRPPASVAELRPDLGREIGGGPVYSFAERETYEGGDRNRRSSFLGRRLDDLADSVFVFAIDHIDLIEENR